MFLFGKAYVNVTNGKKEYVMNELWKGSGRKMSAGKQCLLLSLGGFLLGILFFWLFKNSFVEELRKMNESVSVTAKQGQPLLATNNGLDIVDVFVCVVFFIFYFF